MRRYRTDYRLANATTSRRSAEITSGFTTRTSSRLRYHRDHDELRKSELQRAVLKDSHASSVSFILFLPLNRKFRRLFPSSLYTARSSLRQEWRLVLEPEMTSRKSRSVISLVENTRDNSATTARGLPHSLHKPLNIKGLLE
jgi:hypothetical protein